MSYMTLGQITVKTPSGHEATLSVDEEKAIAKRVLEEKVVKKMLASSQRKEAVIHAGIQAIGTAVGFAAAGILLGMLTGSEKAKKALPGGM